MEQDSSKEVLFLLSSSLTNRYLCPCRSLTAPFPCFYVLLFLATDAILQMTSGVPNSTSVSISQKIQISTHVVLRIWKDNIDEPRLYKNQLKRKVKMVSKLDGLVYSKLGSKKNWREQRPGNQCIWPIDWSLSAAQLQHQHTYQPLPYRWWRV